MVPIKRLLQIPAIADFPLVPSADNFKSTVSTGLGAPLLNYWRKHSFLQLFLLRPEVFKSLVTSVMFIGTCLHTDLMLLISDFFVL